METIFVLLPLALLFAGIALALFVWAARSGQFDDLETPAVRILFDDDPVAAPRPGPGESRGEGTPARQAEADQTRRDPE
jgi:cbb3-type cytochrome oxidase maturation protein